jgi:hypothetical protein
MLSNLVAWWKSLPEWTHFCLAGTVGLVVMALLQAPRERRERKEAIATWGWLLSLVAINGIWGVPGLLIAFGFGGGIAAVQAISRLDKAEARRRRRLLVAIQAYARAEHVRLCGDPSFGFDEKKNWVDYSEFLRNTYYVDGDYELLDKFDEEGVTAEDLHAMQVESETKAAKYEAERAAEKAKAASQPDG